MDMNIQETITNLERLQSLYDRLNELDTYINGGCLKETQSKIDEVKTGLGTLDAIPSAYKNLPVLYNFNEDKLNKLNDDCKRKNKIFKYILIATIAFVVLYFITHWSFLNTISTIGVFASAISGFFYYSEKSSYKKEKQLIDEAKIKYEKSVADFISSLSTYEEEKKNCIAAAENYGIRYKKAYEEIDTIVDDWSINKTKAIEEFLSKYEEVQGIGIVPIDYAHLIPVLILLLKSGRADTLKEALNIAIEEERIAQRDAVMFAQEQRRTQILQQQAAEQQRHNRQLEQEAQVQSRIAQVQADNAVKEARHQRNIAAINQRNAAHDEYKTRREAVRRCYQCANYPKCHAFTPNCGAFIAKR